MSLDLLRPFYDAYHDTVVGLRTGQTGRANSGLMRLTTLLTELIERMSADDQSAALPVINQMLAARSSNDTTTLADLVQYTLPKVLSRTEIAPHLLNPEIITALRGAHSSTANARPIEHLTETVRSAYRQFSQTQGLSVYHAAPLLARKAHSDAKALLHLENSSAIETPAVAYLLSLTLAYEGNHTKAVAIMEDAYAKCPTLRNGFIRIGQIKSAQGDHKGGLSIANKDAAAERMTPQWQIDLALLHGQAGDFPQAEKLIVEAYEKRPTMKDGFARLGWIRALQRQWPEAQDLMDRDYQNERLSPNQQLYLALIRAHMGAWDAAVQLIDNAYAHAPALKDANVRLGWHGFLLGKGIHTFSELINKDLQAGRFSLAGEATAALCHAIQGDFATACSSVERYYREYTHAQKQQWAVIGWVAFKQGNPELACELMLRDYRTGCLATAWLPSMALVLTCTGNPMLADEVIDKLARDTGAEDLVTIGYHFAPDGILPFETFRATFRGSSLAQEAMQWNWASGFRAIERA